MPANSHLEDMPEALLDYDVVDSGPDFRSHSAQNNSSDLANDLDLDSDWNSQYDDLLNKTYTYMDMDMDGDKDFSDFSSILEPDAQPFTISKVTIILLYAFVIFIGTSGNVIVLVAVVSRSKMRIPRNFFIATLALSDLFMVTISLPLSLWELYVTEWPFKDSYAILCKGLFMAQVFPVFMSSFCIPAIAVDRYRCIVCADRSPFSTKRTLLICVCLAFLASLSSLPPALVAIVKPLINIPYLYLRVCTQEWSIPGVRAAYSYTACAIQFFIPVVFVVYTNFRVMRRLKQRPPSQHEAANERRRRTNNILVAMMLVFLIGWFPINIFKMLMETQWISHGALAGNEEITYSMLKLLGASSACCNPVLYGYLNENFRNEYKHIYQVLPWHRRSTIIAGQTPQPGQANENQALMGNATTTPNGCRKSPTSTSNGRLTVSNGVLPQDQPGSLPALTPRSASAYTDTDFPKPVKSTMMAALSKAAMDNDQKNELKTQDDDEEEESAMNDTTSKLSSSEQVISSRSNSCVIDIHRRPINGNSPEPNLGEGYASVTIGIQQVRDIKQAEEGCQEERSRFPSDASHDQEALLSRELLGITVKNMSGEIKNSDSSTNEQETLV